MKWLFLILFSITASADLPLQQPKYYPTMLGSARTESSWTTFACYQGRISETSINEASSFRWIDVETAAENSDVPKNAVQITISAFSANRIQRQLVYPQLDPKYASDPRCKNAILTSYELAGALRLTKRFYFDPSELQEAAKVIRSTASLADFVGLNAKLSILFEIEGMTAQFTTSDERVNPAVLMQAKSQQEFLTMTWQLIDELNALYPADRANRLQPSATAPTFVEYKARKLN